LTFTNSLVIKHYQQNILNYSDRIVLRKLCNHMSLECKYYWTRSLYIWYNDNIFLPCRQKPAVFRKKHTRLRGALWCLDTQLTLRPLKTRYVPKFNQINTSLWMVDCTFAFCSDKCEVKTTSHQKMLLKVAKFPPHLTHFPQGDYYNRTLVCEIWIPRTWHNTHQILY
jgi:hypothetical protein